MRKQKKILNSTQGTEKNRENSRGTMSDNASRDREVALKAIRENDTPNNASGNTYYPGAGAYYPTHVRAGTTG